MYTSLLSLFAVLVFVFATEAAPAPNPVFGRSAFSGSLLSRGALRREPIAAADGTLRVLSKRRGVPSIPEAGSIVESPYFAPAPAADSIELRARHSRDMFHLH